MIGEENSIHLHEMLQAATVLAKVPYLYVWLPSLNTCPFIDIDER